MIVETADILLIVRMVDQLLIVKNVYCRKCYLLFIVEHIDQLLITEAVDWLLIV